MADITTRYDGQVDESDQVNWRGDQTVLPQGSQSIYKTSSVKMAELGERKVVGDRVFRYAKVTATIAAGDVVESQPETLLLVTGGATNASGGKQFTWYAATTMAKDAYADGYLYCQSGTAANKGYTYKIKSHAAIATTSTGVLTLYDPLKLAVNVTDKWSIQQNLYGNCLRATTGVASKIVGVTPVAATTNDYFWLQVAGPCGVKSAAATQGDMVVADATGQVIAFDNKSSGTNITFVGRSLVDNTASEHALVFLTLEA